MTDYYVEPAVGNDANAGTDWGAGNSWATIQKAADTATAGDTVYLKGTETLTAQVDFDTNAGDNTNGYIKFIGVNSSGVNDGTMFVVDGDKDNTNIDGLVFSNPTAYLYFENIEIKNVDNDGVTHSGTSTPSCVFINCLFHDCGAFGFDGYRFTRCIFIRCSAYNNGNDGFSLSAYCVFYFCSSHDNGVSGFDLVYSSYTAMIGCLAYDNSDDGIGNLYFSHAFNCVADGNSDDGVSVRTTTSNYFSVIGCRITNHLGAGDIGLDVNTSPGVIGWSYFENNDGANIQADTLAVQLTCNGSATNIEDQSDTDQGYTDLTDGAEDYNLNSDASLRRIPVSIP